MHAEMTINAQYGHPSDLDNQCHLIIEQTTTIGPDVSRKIQALPTALLVNYIKAIYHIYSRA
jgi:hypothetical protein